MAKETKKVKSYYADVDKDLGTYGAFGWKLLSQNGTSGMVELVLYRDTEQPHDEELIKAEALYEAKKNEYYNVPRPVKPEEPKFLDFKGRKEYPKKLSDFHMAEIRYDNTRRALWKEIEQIVIETKLNYIID